MLRLQLQLCLWCPKTNKKPLVSVLLWPATHLIDPARYIFIINYFHRYSAKYYYGGWGKIWVGGNFNPKSADFGTFYPQKCKFFPNKIFPFKMQIEIESEKYRENFILPYQKVWSQSQVHEESNKPHFNPQHYDLVFSIW